MNSRNLIGQDPMDLIGQDPMELRKRSPGDRNRPQTVSKTVTRVSIPHPLDPLDNR